VTRKYGPCIGMQLDSIDLASIEKLLESKGVIINSEAWTTRDGVLHISIEQRAPVLRFQRGAEGFYIDHDGYVFPLHPSYTAEVPLVEGAIPPIEGEGWESWTAGVLELNDFVSKSRVWRDKVEKISVAGKGDIELKLADCGERFILGWPDAIPEKFAKIEKYFSTIQPSLEDIKYKSVNLKYNKQIICRKDI